MSNEKVLAKMEKDIYLRGLSDSTLYGYSKSIAIFLDYCGKPADKLTESDVRKFLVYLKEDRKLTNGTINCYISAIRFLFELTLEKPLSQRKVPKFKYNRAIPTLLTKDEIQRVFENTTNLMYRTILMMIYGSGLRVSEAINLKVSDIDSEKMRILIRNGKGGKDRYAPLSHVALDTLRVYWKSYRPKDDLFLTSHKMKPAVQTIRNIFNKSMASAGIDKHVTIHSLRHSFATHLLEDDVNIFHIKTLLGHSSIRSTVWYFQLADTATAGITCPLDKMTRIPDGGSKE